MRENKYKREKKKKKIENKGKVWLTRGEIGGVWTCACAHDILL